MDGQRWAPTYPQNYSITPLPLSNYPMQQVPSFPLQGPHHDVPKKQENTNLQQQVRVLQQQMQGPINSSSGSIIGSTSLANSGKTSILSLISSLSNLHSS